jgi:hypothetical protein
MKDEKNTDSIFRGKLKNFQVQPPPHIWDNVQRQLAAQRTRTRRMYIGWISTAAVVVLAFLAGWYFSGDSTVEENSIVTNEIVKPEKNTTETEIQSNEIPAQNNIEQQPVNRQNETKNSDATTLIAVSPVSSKQVSGKADFSDNKVNTRETIRIIKIESADAQLARNQKTNIELVEITKTNSINTLTEQEQLLVAENIRNIDANQKQENNWKMGMFVAPGYSSYTASHSESYSQNMTYSGNSGNANVGGGFSVQYKTNKRWIFESGVYYAQNGQESNNTVSLLAANRESDNMFAPGESKYFINTVQVENNNLAMNSTAGVIAFDATPKGAELSGDFEASKDGVANLLVPDGQFSQVFEFMEIPLYVRYRVVDSKVGVELITGLNAGVVVGNNAYIDNQYGIQNIGETQDISPVNLSGTLGVGINYALGKHFSVAVEPRFNYYLNSINTNSAVDFRPYRIGFYTGVTYEF